MTIAIEPQATERGRRMPRRLRIGLVGFFNWGNYGDELFVEVHKKYLSDQFDLKIMHDLTAKPYFSGSVTEAISTVDAIVIGGGDLIIPWSLSELYWKPEYLSKPVLIVGVGVPTWKKSREDVLEKMRSFLSHPSIKLINLRDKPSYDYVVKNFSPTAPITHSVDIVFGLDFPTAQRPDKKVLGIVTRYRRGGDDNYTQLTELCSKAQSFGWQIRQIILGTGETGERDEETAKRFEFPEKEVVRSENLTDLSRAIGECSALASMKFHGTVVAAAYGVPSIVLSPTDKSRNFMRMIEREDLLSNLHDSMLPDHFSPFMARIPACSSQMLRDRAVSTMQDLAQRLHRLGDDLIMSSS
jgi:polysaccharide pyruvyl transferase WcaK-like protein